jgi:GTP cyclohydrolase IA
VSAPRLQVVAAETRRVDLAAAQRAAEDLLLALDELVVVRDIPFQSLCMHHPLPFHGLAHVAYLPAERIIGLSKLARVVEHFARDLQVQERLTKQVSGCIEQELAPKGVGVVLEAEHLCMSLRGVQKAGARTVTSALHGLVRDDPRTREEFLSLTGGGTR